MMSPKGDAQEEIHAQFEREYCPPLDTATLLAILRDYDITNASEFEAARQVLDVIREGAAAEETSGFDPSGSSWAHTVLLDEKSVGLGEEGCNSARSKPGWASQTDNISISHEMSILDLEELKFSEPGIDNKGKAAAENSDSGLADLDDESKKLHLGAIFPALRPFDIEWSLKKYRGDADLAIDELMTQSFLEESGTRHRGIEAFSEGDSTSRPRRSKGKKKRSRWVEETASSSESTLPAAVSSKWETGKRDIEFISSRTRMPMEQVGSLYHENGASIKATISAIINAHAALKVESNDDAMMQLHAHTLSQKVPSIPLTDLIILVQITHPNEVFAHDLATVLASRPAINIKSNIQLEFRHAPIDLDSGLLSPNPLSYNAVYINEPRIQMDAATASAMATTYKTSRDKAFIQASTAYRRGKSDHLMGGAAAYYSEVGRKYDARAKSAESAAADALVAGQSSSTELDLHGVNVKDAVRISRERVTAWWHSLGDSRFTGITGSYKIVTGLGNHSKEGRARLGPAVGKMLIREGWKVEIGQGALVVTGIYKSPVSRKK